MSWYNNGLIPDTKVRFVRHASAEAALASMWRGTGVTLSDLRAATTIGVDVTGKRHEISHAEELRSVKRMGFWGWADERKRVVHYWHNGRQNAAALAHLLGHEVGHILRAVKLPRMSGYIREEAEADRHGLATALVLRHLQRTGVV